MIVYIDTENVNSDWTNSFPYLSEEDEVNIFYTKNSKPLDLSRLDDFRNVKAKVVLIESPVGDNALDFSLASYLGSKLESSKKHIILSGDKGYISLIKFWENKAKLLVFTNTSLFIHYLKKGEILEDDFIRTVSIKDIVGITDEDRETIIRILSNTRKTDLAEIHEKLVKEFGSEVGTNYYKYIKKFLKKERAEENGTFIGS